MRESSSPKPFDVDHINPAADPLKDNGSWDEWIEGLFCASSELQVLCKECHKSKTERENSVRISKRK
jgi:5-methylcytosine-specific restriction endonuclease McrA